MMAPVLFLHEAASLNQQGVHALTSSAVHHNQQSRPRIRKALRLFRQALARMETISRILPNKAAASRSSSSPNHGPRIHSSAASVMPPPPSEGDPVFFVYHRALEFQPQGVVMLTVHAIYSYSAAIAFNIGLCYHVLGSQPHPAKRTQHLRHALSFYDRSFQVASVLDHHMPLNDHSAMMMMTMLKLVALNNACHIQWQLGDLAEFHQGLEGVRALAAQIIVRHTASLAAAESSTATSSYHDDIALLKEDEEDGDEDPLVLGSSNNNNGATKTSLVDEFILNTLVSTTTLAAPCA